LLCHGFSLHALFFFLDSLDLSFCFLLFQHGKLLLRQTLLLGLISQSLLFSCFFGNSGQLCFCFGDLCEPTLLCFFFELSL